MSLLTSAATRRKGMLSIELVVAMGILVSCMTLAAVAAMQQHIVARDLYYRATAGQVVDGEFEIIVAGEWKSLPEGVSEYKPDAAALRHLPPGRFTFTRQDRKLRLEWAPEKRHHGGRIIREGVAK
jgi:hypothetical protein